MRKEKEVSGIIDIHSHILAGVDDGAGSWEEAVRMLQMAQQQGIRAIVATPHFMPGRRNASTEHIKSAAAQLQSLAQENGCKIKIFAGNEIYYHEEVLEQLEEGRIFTLAGSAYILVEFAPLDDYRYIRNSLSELQAAGYCPILAHTERYENLCRKPFDKIEELRSMGVLIQINTGSLEGKMGKTMRARAFAMLKNRQADFVATDAHGTKDRAPDMEKSRKIIKKKCSKEYAELLFYKNAEELLFAEQNGKGNRY